MEGGQNKTYPGVATGAKLIWKSRGSISLLFIALNGNGTGSAPLERTTNNARDDGRANTPGRDDDNDQQRVEIKERNGELKIGK